MVNIPKTTNIPVFYTIDNGKIIFDKELAKERLDMEYEDLEKRFEKVNTHN